MEPLTIAALGLAAATSVGAVVFARRAASSLSAAAVSEERACALEADTVERIERAKAEARVESKAAIMEARQRAEEDAEASRRAAEADHKSARQALAGDEQRIKERRSDLDRRANRAEQREQDLLRREEKLTDRESELDERSAGVEGMHAEVTSTLERVAALSPEEARLELLAQVEEQTRGDLAKRIKAVEEEITEQAEKTAKKIISLAIQRYAGDYVCERTVSVVTLQSDELKGRIIGREGRNIRALEAATGVDFIIDDTPDTVVISAFNPIRREVAKSALQTLLEDGRIHPSRIEAVVRKAESDFHRVIKAAGEEAADEVGVSGVHPEILKLLGALKYRTSYGQNQWQHAIEVAFLSGMMAGELGLDVRRAKRAGLLHDIGKVLDQTAEGSHALIGAEFARRHGESNLVCNAIASHHEEVPQETIYAVLAQAADAMSGARPGARREVMRNYTQRLHDLERISNSFPGVDRSYAVQAGREVRILVENASVTDEEAVMLSRGIARKIENEMSYPGQIKVTVIRETRVVQYAR